MKSRKGIPRLALKTTVRERVHPLRRGETRQVRAIVLLAAQILLPQAGMSMHQVSHVCLLHRETDLCGRDATCAAQIRRA
jgi:hypothetical protein